MSKYTIYFDDNTYLEVEADKFIPKVGEGYIALFGEEERFTGLIMMQNIQAIVLSNAINPEDNERLAKKDGGLSEGERKEMNSEVLERFYNNYYYRDNTKTT